MTNSTTLHSRLRMLVAKTFRAEKLYSSLRKPRNVDTVNISDLANDLRAREWERAHAQFRTALNSALELPSQTALFQRVSALYHKFHNISEECSEKAKTDRDRLIETAEREEFAHSLKLSLELVRIKARAQAHKVISDELSSIIQLAHRASSFARDDSEASASLPVNIAATPAEQEEVSEETPSRLAVNSNVIPFRRFQRRL